MYHTIRFVREMTISLEGSSQRYLERVRVGPGERRRAQVKPYVLESKSGPTEVADLFFDDGTVARAVRFGCFSFVD